MAEALPLKGYFPNLDGDGFRGIQLRNWRLGHLVSHGTVR
jgi:hypothetical protein